MLIESFLDYLQYERNYSEKTVLAYGEDIKQLQEFAQEEYGKFNPLEVEAELIREWIVSLMDKGYTSTSVNRKLSSLRTFYKYLLRQGETTIDPLRKIKGPKNKKPLPVFLKENEMNRLLDETDFGEGFKGCRDRLIIEMFYATGMRLSELIGLDNKDVDFSASLLKVTGKRNKQRLIPFGDELQELMLEYISVRNETIPERSEAFFIRENGERLYKNLVYNLVKRNIHEAIREDAYVLYGFAEKQEREIFLLLISVSGIGGNTARMILSALSPAELVNVISTENANMLKTVKGIGLKTAQRLIVELKDKIKTVGMAAVGGTTSAGMLLQSANAEVQEEAVAALTMLGFAAAPSQKVVLAVLKEEPEAPVEKVIKLALKRL